jgi:FKBP-type peptidyl-prolyl cis-trans isomerase FkpA
VLPALARRTAALALLLLPALLIAQQGERPAQNRNAAGGQKPAAERKPAVNPANAPAEGGAEFKSEDEKLSYVLGVNTARRMKQDNVNPEPQAFTRGFLDEASGKSLLSDEEMTQVLDNFRRQLQEKAATARQQLTKGWETAFAKKPEGEPKTTKSGLKYEVLEQGKGKKPAKTDVVVVHYVGKLQDGKVFDSSLASGSPAVLQLDQVIKGWTEGLQLMPVGSKYRFQVPAALAYGKDGFPPDIPANADLTFEVELLDIMPPQNQEGGAPAPEAPEKPAE